MNHNITIAILAGGKSSRMGTDKGMLLFQEKRLIDYSIEKALRITDRVMLIANHESYSGLGLPCYKDLIKDCGPMGGIYTALKLSTTQKVLVIGCDMPFLEESLLRTMIEISDSEEILVAEYKNQWQPLCAIYDKDLTEPFKNLMNSGQLSLKKAIGLSRHAVLVTDNLEGINSRCFININTPSELKNSGKGEI